jgi:hypothetical protein
MEVTVIGVQRADAVLEQDSCDMSVRDQIAANRCPASHMLVGIYEAVQLGNGTHVRQPDERGDVPERFVRRQRCPTASHRCAPRRLRRNLRP